MKTQNQGEEIALWSSWARDFLKDTPDMAFVKDRSLVYVGASPAFAAVIGLDTPEQVVGHTDLELFKEAALAEKYREDDRRMIEGDRPLGPFVEPLPEIDGKREWTMTRKGLIHGADGEVLGVYGISKRITSLERLESKRVELELENRRIRKTMADLSQAVRMDPLSRLLNHAAALDTIRAFLSGEGLQGSHALFLVDIDNFKAANDQFGHARGDEAIAEQAGSLKKLFRETDIKGRIGGDEFLILMKNVSGRAEVRAKAAQLLHSLQIKISNDTTELRLTSSVGAALCENGDYSFEELFSNAEKALYEAKGNGKNQYSVWGCSGLDACGGILEDCPGTEISSPLVLNKWRRILIADDDPYSRKLLQKALERNYAVDTVPDGVQALKALHTETYSLLITDIQMPAMTGWELLAAMKNEEFLLNVPVIVITADGNSESEVKALNLGATDVIVKPFVSVTLLSRVKNTIARHEARLAEEKNRLYEIQLRQQEKLLRLAELDDLTGLYNRKAFVKKASELIREKPSEMFSVASLDINGFKVVNDRFGHDEGDRLLRFIAENLSIHLSNWGYLLCRDVADCYILLLPNDADTARRIANELQRNLAGYSLSMRLTLSIGVYTVVDTELDVNLMIDRAVLARKSVKGRETESIAWYTDEMRQQVLTEKALTDEMRPALAQGQFEVWFQPQSDYSTGKISGAEALVRWRHPEKGLIPPGDFIPLFEKNGFISELDQYVWEQSCRLLRGWLDTPGIRVPSSISVNISRMDVYNPNLVSLLLEIVARNRLSPSLLHLEITESAYMEDPAQLIGIVKELRKNGFTVEMDDFGSGYSSLNTLKDVPVDILKLDMRFLSSDRQDRTQNSVGNIIIGAVIRMAQSIERPVIAEGVETREQADFLHGLGCRYMQGYYFSKPLPPVQFQELLK